MVAIEKHVGLHLHFTSEAARCAAIDKKQVILCLGLFINITRIGHITVVSRLVETYGRPNCIGFC